MLLDLVRFQQSGQSHFLTFRCYRRMPRFEPRRFRDLFLESLERMRRIYRFQVYGYVVMPEHVHLLVSEPEEGLLASALQALKISVARRARSGPPVRIIRSSQKAQAASTFRPFPKTGKDRAPTI